MPLYRFETFEEAERALWMDRQDPRLSAAIRWVWELSAALTRHYPHPRGVFKFVTIEEANAHRDAWEKERCDYLQKLHSKSSK